MVVLVRIKEIRELQKTDSGLLQLFLCIVPASPEKTIANSVYYVVKIVSLSQIMHYRL